MKGSTFCVVCDARLDGGRSHRPHCRRGRKPRPDLLPARALLEAGRAMAQRTDRDDAVPGWRSIPVEKYRASLARHVLAYLAGETVDADSGLDPLAHVITNAAILLERRRSTKEAPDVPASPPATAKAKEP